ncbi:UNVERIFIED_CONTAM: hypothetical protein Sindi_2910000 [Sesamum indicum]
MKYECPRLSLLIITPIPKANVIGPKSYNHSNFFKVTAPEARPRPVKTRSASPAEGTRRPVHTRGGPAGPTQDLPSNGSSLRDLDCTHSNYQTRRARLPQSALVRAPSRSADRLSPFHIRSGRIAGPHPLPSRQFQALFDSLFKVFFIFPSRYLFAIGLSPVFSLGRNLPPDWGCIPKQPDSPTAPRGAAGSGHDGALTLSGAPFQGTWARSAAEDASPDYNSDSEAARFSSWAVPGSLAVTRGILRVIPPDLGSRSEALASFGSNVMPERTTPSAATTARELSVQPPLVVTSVAAGSHLGRPRADAHGRPMSAPHAMGGGGDAMRDAQADVPWPNGFWAQLAFKDSMVHGILQFTPSIAFRYVLHRCESRDIRCRESVLTFERRPLRPCTPRTGPPCGGRFVRFSLARAAPGVR